jgi:hypothetical protein
MQILINVRPDVRDEPDAAVMVTAAVRRILDRSPTYINYAIHVYRRNQHGVMEGEIFFNLDAHGDWVPGQSTLVGLIQRKPGGEVEFHS